MEEKVKCKYQRYMQDYLAWMKKDWPRIRLWLIHLTRDVTLLSMVELDGE
jgi:hypothetical protein